MIILLACLLARVTYNHIISNKKKTGPVTVADLGEGPGGPTPSPLFWVKKGGMTEGRKAGWASKLKPGPLLISKSGSATAGHPFPLFNVAKRMAFFQEFDTGRGGYKILWYHYLFGGGLWLTLLTFPWVKELEFEAF